MHTPPTVSYVTPFAARICCSLCCSVLIFSVEAMEVIQSTTFGAIACFARCATGRAEDFGQEGSGGSGAGEGAGRAPHQALPPRAASTKRSRALDDIAKHGGMKFPTKYRS